MVSEHDGAIEHSTRNPVSTLLRKTFYVRHDTQRVSNALMLACAARTSALVARIRLTVRAMRKAQLGTQLPCREGGGTRAGLLT
ncbi:MAG: hypothetical protein QOJ58_4769 [Alphaproteobacteria bacterium]|nr:hypothetical protein [Alphaproteobacteria bacterium]